MKAFIEHSATVDSGSRAARDGELGLDALRIHWLRSANGTVSNSILSGIRGTDFTAEQIFSMAGEGRGDVERAARLAKTNGAVHELNGPAFNPANMVYAAVIRRLHAAALAHDVRVASTTIAASGNAVEPMPEGVSQLLPARPAAFDLTKLPKSTVIDVLAKLETHENPVSSPRDALPADPLFKLWMQSYSMLGTRSLTMAEMAGLNDADVRWEGLATGMRDRSTFRIQINPNEKRMHRHEVHKYTGGFKQEPGHGALDAGRGGETSLFARMTDFFNDHDIPDKWGDEQSIRDYWRDHRSAVRTDTSAQAAEWSADQKTLASGTRDQLLEKLHYFHNVGYFADPRQEAKLRPSAEALLASAPGSAERARAAQAIVDNFRQRASNPDVVSVSGATAEIQMAQTLYRYMAENNLDFQRSNDRIDVVEVYKLYRKMDAAGELTTRATVEGWLTQWGAPHVP